jgi:hypothetical protein
MARIKDNTEKKNKRKQETRSNRRPGLCIRIPHRRAKRAAMRMEYLAYPVDVQRLRNKTLVFA